MNQVERERIISVRFFSLEFDQPAREIKRSRKELAGKHTFLQQVARYTRSNETIIQS